MDLRAMLANSKLETTNAAETGGPVTVEAGLTISLEGVRDVRVEVDQVLAGTKLGEFANEVSEKDISRKNYCLAWVHAWTQYIATELAMGKVVGKLKEKGGRHRQAPLSNALAAQFAGTAIASGLAGRLMNIQVGPPTGMHKTDALVMIDGSEMGPLDGDNMGLILENPEIGYMGSDQPAGLVVLLQKGMLVSAERACSYDAVYADEAPAVLDLLKEFQTRRGFWKEMKPGAVLVGGDLVWDPTDDQNDVVFWSDLDHVLRGRLVWTGHKGGWGAQALPTNGECALIYRKMQRKQTTR